MQKKSICLLLCLALAWGTGCGGGGGGGGSNPVAPLAPAGTTSGTGAALTQTADPAAVDSAGALVATELAKVNDLAQAALLQTLAGSGSYDLGENTPAGVSLDLGADVGAAFAASWRGADLTPDSCSDETARTLTAGAHTLQATITTGSGGVLSRWCEFYVPSGKIALDFKLVALSAGTTATGFPVPNFCLLDNEGREVFIYDGRRATVAGRSQPAVWPDLLGSLRLGALTRSGRLRPYRLFVGGGGGARVVLSCTVVDGALSGYTATQAGSGDLQVTLAWNTAGNDVDLHLVEPDGSHVYYNSKTGTTAELDYDDTDGYGPENVYIKSGTLPAEGRYRIYLHYYDNGTVSGPVTCAVRIKTRSNGNGVVVSRSLTVKDEKTGVADVTFLAGTATVVESTAVPASLRGGVPAKR